MKINIVRLGKIEYQKALEIQTVLQKKRQENQIDNTLLLLEHFPVITLGTRGKTDNIYLPKSELIKNNIEVVNVNRGGDVTYHGLGQIVGYPIFDLRDVNRDIKLFLQKIEQTILDLLYFEYNIKAYTESGKFTGVWVDDKKITAIGISVSKSVTMHGFAFNVNTNLDHFKWINPCGLNKGVTSVKDITGREQDMDKMFTLVQKYFEKQFDTNANIISINELL